MTGGFSLWHWAIVALVVVILFGSKKLPEAARGLGRSLRIFKSEVKEMQNDGNSQANPAADPNQSAQLPSAPVDATVVETPQQPRTEPKSA
ncbi:Sec-independent protein translocase subunit TatA [Rhodococcus sp. SGAir0479]|uniref:Sec-independent protein translocase subunit TatA n=1 Tax=Rhodococcus sp. SGAir0479 TaxID=2567884 RepID=UPI0010CD2072|nr:Sec-independent protein translocase subunit TatA [Rhodococcus sp. SGAir0479]QCQ91081.1 Sec-independent protein translocase subunit TatA [Rhodococcus sp. SGAir0479]